VGCAEAIFLTTGESSFAPLRLPIACAHASPQPTTVNVVPTRVHKLQVSYMYCCISLTAAIIAYVYPSR
jgi:hypothetical protein